MARDFNRCISALRTAAGRNLSEDEIADALGRIHQTALDIKAGRFDNGKTLAGSEEQLIRQAAQVEAARMVQEAELKARRAVMDAQTAQTRLAEVNAMTSAGLNNVEAVRRLIVNAPDGRADAFSLETRVHGIRKHLLSKLEDTWLALGDDFLDFFRRPEMARNLIQEMRGKDTGDALAKKGAEAWRKVTEEARQWFNERGGRIGKLEDWGLPQHHSQDMVARAAQILGGNKTPDAPANRTAWVDYVLPKLDRQRYTDLAGRPMDDAELRTFLERAWNTIATGGAANIEPGRTRGTGARANRHAEERQIHFKDADAVLEYWGRFGDRTLPDIMFGHVESMAKDIGFIEQFGSNPNAMYRMLRDGAEQAAKTKSPQSADRIDAQLGSLDRLYNYAAGITAPVANRKAMRVFDTLRNLNIAGKLGSAFWASLIGDKVMFEAMGRVNNLPDFQRWYNELRLLNPANAADRRMLRRHGLMLDFMSQAMYRFGEELGSSALSAKLANGVMRVTGMSAVNEWRRGAWALTAMDTIGHLTRTKDWSQVGQQDMRLLGSYGITEADWKVWQKAKLEDMGHGNKEVLTPEAIMQVADADLASVMPERFQAVRDAIRAKVDNLNARNVKEAEWIALRTERLAEAQDISNRAIKRMKERRDTRNEAAAESILQRMSLLEAQREQAELFGRIEADLNKFTTQDEVRSFLNAVEDGASADKTSIGPANRALRTGLSAAESAGRRYGEAKGRLERRMRELENKVTEMDRATAREVDRATKEATARIDAIRAEFVEKNKAALGRMSRREAVIQKELGSESAQLAATANEIRRDAMIKFLGAITSESHIAVIEPGWSERAMMYGGLQRGNIRDELTRSFWQFKGFPFTQLERILQVGLSRPSTTGKVAFLTTLPILQTLTGAMMLQVQEMLGGKDPRPMGDWKFWAAAFLKGGTLGIYGDFLFSQSGTTRYGTGPLEAAAGPTIGAAADIVTFMAQAPGQLAKGEEPRVAAKSINILKGFVPGQNIWFTKAATDHMIFQNAQEALNPGYLAALRRRRMQEFGTDWWWAPGEMLPERAPDLGAAFEARP